MLGLLLQRAGIESVILESRDRDRFAEWMRTHVLETADIGEYHRRLAEGAEAA